MLVANKEALMKKSLIKKITLGIACLLGVGGSIAAASALRNNVFVETKADATIPALIGSEESTTPTGFYIANVDDLNKTTPAWTNFLGITEKVTRNGDSGTFDVEYDNDTTTYTVTFHNYHYNGNGPAHSYTSGNFKNWIFMYCFYFRAQANLNVILEGENELVLNNTFYPDAASKFSTARCMYAVSNNESQPFNDLHIDGSGSLNIVACDGVNETTGFRVEYMNVHFGNTENPNGPTLSTRAGNILMERTSPNTYRGSLGVDFSGSIMTMFYVNNGSFTAIGGDGGYFSRGFSLGSGTVINGGTVTGKGGNISHNYNYETVGFAFYDAYYSATFNGGALSFSGGIADGDKNVSAGILFGGSSAKTLTIGENVVSLTTSGYDNAIFDKSSSHCLTVASSLSGSGWNNKEGTGDKSSIPAGNYVSSSEESASFYAYKKIELVSKEVPEVTAPTAKDDLVYNGNTQTLVNAGSTTGGTLKYKLNDGEYSTTLPSATNADDYTVYYKVEGDETYADVGEQSFNVTISKADPDPVGTLDATFGQKLSDIALPNGWAWTDATQSVGNVGSHDFAAHYTAVDTNHHDKDASITVSVSQATPTGYDVPTGLEATYGDNLSSVALPSTWSWKTPTDKVGDAGNREHTAIYTPTDPNYKAVEETLTITVAKANPTVPTLDTVDAPYDVALSTVGLPEGFSWMDGTQKTSNWGENTFKVKYTPADQANYNVIENIDVKVNVKWILVDPTAGDVSVTINGDNEVFNVDISVKVEVKTEVTVDEKRNEYASLATKDFVKPNEDISAIYGVKLIRTTNGVEEEIQPSDIKPGTKITVSMVIPEELIGKDFRLLHIHNSDDITEVTNYAVSKDGKTLMLEVDRLSDFAFIT